MLMRLMKICTHSWIQKTRRDDGIGENQGNVSDMFVEMKPQSSLNVNNILGKRDIP